MNEITRSLSLFHPEIALTVALLLVVVVDSTGARIRGVLCQALTILGLAAALVLSVPLAHSEADIWSGMLTVDPLGVFFKMLLVGASLLLALIFNFRNSRELHGLGRGEFYSLLLAVTLSNLLLASANDLAMLYLALEMVSITSYVMVAYIKGDRFSNEASLKYVLFGAVSTGGMLYGLSLLYGMAGTTSVPGIREFLTKGVADASLPAVYTILLLLLLGFGFKTAAVPFHFWCPDAYQGAPTPVTAFLSVAPKAAGFAIMARFFFQGFAAPVGSSAALGAIVDWPRLLILVSVATMTVGNVAALTQTNMKRLLAYLFMNLGAFLVVTLIHEQDGTFDLRDYPGLYRRAPFLTGAMVIFLLSLMGIPPLVGFMGKLYVFAAIVDKGPSYWWYAVVAALNAAVAAYYYARVMKTMVIDEPAEEKPPFRLAFPDAAWLAVLLAANVLPLLFWGTIDGWARQSFMLYAGR
jgi:NADH-quinone oxidoreductase subunit N